MKVLITGFEPFEGETVNPARAAVAALPGTCFGKVGKDYVRFSLLKSEDQLREAVRRVAAVLA